MRSALMTVNLPNACNGPESQRRRRRPYVRIVVVVSILVVTEIKLHGSNIC